MQETAVEPHEGHQIGLRRDFTFAGTLLIGDQIVDAKDVDVELAVDQIGHQESGVRRDRQLHRNTVFGKKP